MTQNPQKTEFQKELEKHTVKIYDSKEEMQADMPKDVFPEPTRQELQDFLTAYKERPMTIKEKKRKHKKEKVDKFDLQLEATLKDKKYLNDLMDYALAKEAQSRKDYAKSVRRQEKVNDIVLLETWVNNIWDKARDRKEYADCTVFEKFLVEDLAPLYKIMKARNAKVEDGVYDVNQLNDIVVQYFMKRIGNRKPGVEKLVNEMKDIFDFEYNDKGKLSEQVGIHNEDKNYILINVLKKQYGIDKAEKEIEDIANEIDEMGTSVYSIIRTANIAKQMKEFKERLEDKGITYHYEHTVRPLMQKQTEKMTETMVKMSNQDMLEYVKNFQDLSCAMNNGKGLVIRQNMNAEGQLRLNGFDCYLTNVFNRLDDFAQANTDVQVLNVNLNRDIQNAITEAKRESVGLGKEVEEGLKKELGKEKGTEVYVLSLGKKKEEIEKAKIEEEKIKQEKIREYQDDINKAIQYAKERFDAVKEAVGPLNEKTAEYMSEITDDVKRDYLWEKDSPMFNRVRNIARVLSFYEGKVQNMQERFQTKGRNYRRALQRYKAAEKEFQHIKKVYEHEGMEHALSADGFREQLDRFNRAYGSLTRLDGYVETQKQKGLELIRDRLAA